MSTPGPYDILFEPVAIGPVTAKNRFYQVPHCCGLGHARPHAHAAMRAVKAEGGWAVVSTEECEIHPSSDMSPYVEQRIWDERDIPALRLMVDAVHAHGALAAIELAHNGHHANNLTTLAAPLAPVSMASDIIAPRQARAMSLSDIKELRRWHRAAARRAKQAGFDIIYVYAGHRMSLAQHFLLPQLNTRTDEYGGSLENRVRLVRELLEETKEEVGDTCAVAFRFAVDEMVGVDGMQAHEEGRAVVEMLAELPDLWDVNVSDWSNDSATSRFVPEEGQQIPYIEFVKQVTQKPVVAVSRLTSPDLMVSLVKRKIVDLIGAARPSIADPFLPNKIREGRIEDIRECIGCNICVASDSLCVPIRCTQNPTMGEEWRRGWHPEVIAPKVSAARTLVVGGGPAGLECAMQLARRGYEVTLAEASGRLGGRVAGEAGLKGLSAWSRVRDYRVQQLRGLGNVDIYLQSELSADQVVELGIDNVFVATGARWRRDGVGRSRRQGLPGLEKIAVFTPDDIMAGAMLPTGPIVIEDDDRCYLAGVIADHLSAAGHAVTFLTPAGVVSPWCENTLEQTRIQRALLMQDVTIRTGEWIKRVFDDSIEVACVYTGQTTRLACAGLVLVSEREPRRALFDQLTGGGSGAAMANINARLIGDASCPGLIADAVHDGHLAAREFEADDDSVEAGLLRREMPGQAP